MCFYSKSNEIKIAKENIVVHKLFYNKIEEQEEKEGEVFSIVQKFKFNIGELNDEIIIRPIKRYNDFVVYEGYHSYAPGKECFWWEWDSMYKCIIPKGSKYMKSPHEYEGIKYYVSSNIIIVEKIKENEENEE